MIIELAPFEEFHGLRSRPFSLTPDLRFTYHSHSHTHALEEIGQALKRREGLVVVTGEVGTGKTMLCRALLDTFETRTFLSVILDPLLTVPELMHKVLTDFGLMSARPDGAPPTPLTEVPRHDLVATLQKFLASLVPLNAHAVIMIDEAQHLTGPVLEQVRLLSNFETDSQKLLQIVLVGQPNLDILLRRPDMQQLNQRVARRCELEPLTETEVGDYIERRLLVASEDPEADARGERDIDLSGATSSVRFAPSAVKLVATTSGGIPRLVNTLCDRSLAAAFDARSHIVDRKAVLLAAERLRLPLPPRWGGGRRRLVALAAALVLVAIGVWWLSHRSAHTSPANRPTDTGAPSALPDAGAPAASPLVPPTAGAAVSSPAGSLTTLSASATSAPALPPVGTPTATPARDRAAASSSGGSVYEITAASFKTEERAQNVAGRLTLAGFPVESRVDSTGEWYRVVVGPFGSEEEARAAQQRLDSQGFKGTRVYLR